VESFTYATLKKKWDRLLSTPITPGYRQKFKRESQRLAIEFAETELPFKYCGKGCVDRFYVVRNPKDIKPKKRFATCASFSVTESAASEIPIPGPLWQICTTESHGPTMVRGQQFYPGLYENTLYFLLPAHNSIRPEIGHPGRCTVCASEFERGIMIHEVSSFCCNRHYLQWWKERNPKLFDKLNRRR
jgi:hypothetical protein